MMRSLLETRCLEEKVGRKQDLGPRTVVTNSLETASSLFHSRRDGRAAQSGKHKGFVFLWGLPFYGVVSTCKYPRGFSLAQCQPQDEEKGQQNPERRAGPQSCRLSHSGTETLNLCASEALSFLNLWPLTTFSKCSFHPIPRRALHMGLCSVNRTIHQSLMYKQDIAGGGDLAMFVPILES